jgi:hypothetical protein
MAHPVVCLCGSCRIGSNLPLQPMFLPSSPFLNDGSAAIRQQGVTTGMRVAMGLQQYSGCVGYGSEQQQLVSVRMLVLGLTSDWFEGLGS